MHALYVANFNCTIFEKSPYERALNSVVASISRSRERNGSDNQTEKPKHSLGVFIKRYEI